MCVGLFIPIITTRLLGVTFAEDLSLDRHVSNVCKSCFFWLRQLRRVRHSLDIESVKTLVHAFVTSRVEYCNSVLALSPMTVTDKLQRVLNSAARLITATGSSTVVCHSYCTTICTGWMFLSGCSTSWW